VEVKAACPHDRRAFSQNKCEKERYYAVFYSNSRIGVQKVTEFLRNYEKIRSYTDREGGYFAYTYVGDVATIGPG
jgi:hypothetical protein